MIAAPLLAASLPAAIAVASSVQSAASNLAVRRFVRVHGRAGASAHADAHSASAHPDARHASAHAHARSDRAASRPVSVLKPLHGDEPLLEEALASVCAQDHPAFQIVFGVQRHDDPAIGVVERLQRRFPDVDMTLVIDPTPHGPNRKVDNLINMLPHARHDVLVISDADIHAAPDMLRAVVDPLGEAGVGLVTTLYTGLPASADAWRLLGAAQINQAFLPGALMGRRLGREDCLGAVMALERATLAAIGGFESLSPHLADDAVLGRKVRALGLRVALAGTVPATSVTERSFAELFSHELRWGRTVRSQAPFGYPLSALQAPIGWAALAVLADLSPLTIALFAATWTARAITGARIERLLLGRVVTPFWVAPLRDVLTLLVIIASYAGSRVAWRGRTLHTDALRNIRAAELSARRHAERPTADRPGIERPVLERPVLERPVLERPVLEHHVLERPVIDRPALDRPAWHSAN